MDRYLALIWQPSDAHGARAAVSTELSLRCDSAWQTAYEAPGVLVAHRAAKHGAPQLHRLAASAGIILGSLFHRSSEGPSRPCASTFTDDETRRIMDTGCRHLIERYWGSYLAVTLDRASRQCTVLRDPTANLACFHAKCGGLHVFFSFMDDLMRHVRMQLSVNWQYVAARMLSGPSLSRDCGIQEIEDIPGGERVTLSGDSDRRTPLWHPASFCVEDGLQDQSCASRALRATVLDSVQTLASEHSDILLRLSGGLDSSIVAGCLSQARSAIRVNCLNFYISSSTRHPVQAPSLVGFSRENLARMRRVIGSADERPFARAVAAKCGFPLHEFEKRASSYELRRIFAAPLASRPSTYVFAIDEDAAELECARAHKATACFTGQAGDTVFYNTQRPLAVLDYAYLHRLGPDLLSHMRRSIALSGESAARILGKVVRYGILRRALPSPFSPFQRPHLLPIDVASSVPKDYFSHPWQRAARTLCPGKEYHVVGIAQSGLYYPTIYHREDVARSVHPLASQPVVETCLRIPTYILLADGKSRGLARRTFEDLLPPEVARRTTKGAPVGFLQRLLRHNMEFLRECLLDGALVHKGLLDRSKLAAYLVDDQPFLTIQPEQLMEYLACEAWLSQVRPFGATRRIAVDH